MSNAELDEALATWQAAAPRFISESENAVYRVRRNGGGQAALRLHRPGYQSHAAISSELWWTQALGRAGVPVPLPHQTNSGELVVTLSSGRLASMVSWVDGAPFGAAGAPLPGSHAAQERLFFRIGQALARLHDVTDSLTLPADFQRHAWDIDGLLGEAPFWGRFWENPTLSRAERALVLRARAKASEHLQRFMESGADYGLIHADVLRTNVHVNGDTVTLIDFDDAGFGFRLYDLATLMSQNEGLENSQALQDAAVAGYRSRRALPDAALALLPMFIMLRRLASMGWIVPRAAGKQELLRSYARRAVDAAGRFLA